MATINGPVAWIGTIWVAAAQRRHGLGRALTEATLDLAEAAGCATQVLVATDTGRPLYERLGFEVATWYLTMEAPGRGGAVRPPGTERVRDCHGGRTSRRWPRSTERRPARIARTCSAAFVTPGDDARRQPTGRRRGASRVPDPRPVGWRRDHRPGPRRCAGPARRATRRLPGRPPGPLRDPRGERRRAGAPRWPLGWTEAWRAPRLHRGAPLDWAPAGIWGQFNHAMG